MIGIRELSMDDMWEAMELKVLCWPEELAGLSDNVLDLKQEYVFWTNWMNTGKEQNDIRLLYGAFKNSDL